jgi:tetratricopeptide (TPR) repeat protein
MSKHQVEEEDINIGDAYSKAEKFLDEKKQPVGIAVGVVIALILGVFYYFNMYLPPLQKNASEDVYQAQKAFEVDSFELAMYGNGEFIGFEEVIETYGSTDIGNTSKYYMAVSLMHTGAYEDAIDYYKSYSPADHITRALKEGGIGDCLVQLDAYEDAITAYEKAANAYVNDFSTPIYLKKAGIISEEIMDYKSAVKFYERISDQYPNSQEGRDIEKYLAHAQSYVQ